METFVANLDTTTVIFLIVSGFIASFIDSTVGGGGLISTPALLSLGLPVPYALGTNKLAASIGCFTSVLSFWRAGKIKKAAFTLMPLSFIGSALGAYVVLSAAGAADEKYHRCAFGCCCGLYLSP